MLVGLRRSLARLRYGDAVILTSLATFIVYVIGLDLLYLVHDEVVYALNAASIARTGRDLAGDLLPISFPIVGTFYATPLIIYVTAITVKLAHVNEFWIRFPSVIVGALNVGLVFVIGSRMFQNRRLGFLAALILAVTPAHFIHSRLATDHLYLVLIQLAWLGCLIGVEHERHAGRIAAASAILALGIYSYLGAAITVPVCFALTLLYLHQSGIRRPSCYAAAMASFALVAAPFALWHLFHPDQSSKQMQMYGLGTAGAGLLDRAAVYWDYFNPSFLFYAGDTGLINSTRFTGVFLWPMIVLLPLGMVWLLRQPTSPFVTLIVLAFLASPLAATTVGERYRINRALVMLPLAALLAAAGVRALWSARSRAWRLGAITCLAMMPIQFLAFHRDYFVGYPARSQSWFEFNIAGGMEAIIEHERLERVPVFIASNIQWAGYYWPLYLEKHSRTDLTTMTTYIDLTRTNEVDAMPVRAFVLCRAADAAPLLAAGFRLALAVEEHDGSSQFSVLER
jgi:4-amino-4-deoxy-L-arabinose transferase-like glycosyltransferase